MSPRDDDELLGSLEDALNDGPDRTPPADRVAALRARADARARQIDVDSASPVAPIRSRRRDFLVGGIAASVGAAVGVAGAFATEDDGAPAPPMEAISFRGTPSGVRTEASLVNHAWGVELMLDVEGLPAGTSYAVTYDGADGPLAAGSFVAVDVLMHCRFNGARLRADTTSIAITAPDGTEVGRADLV